MTEPLLYEIVNPSDAYTMTAASDLVAAVATLLVGMGRYGLKALNGPETEERSHLVPFLLFGGDDVLRGWCDKHGIADLADWAIDHGEDVAAALESVLVGSHEERLQMEKVLDCISDGREREKARAAYHDGRRSSMNDIGGAAQSLAKRLRGQIAEQRP